MIKCEQCREFMAEALYCELDSARQVKFRQHLEQCQECAEEFQSIQAAMKIADEFQVPEPPPEYWQGYQERLEQALPVQQSAGESVRAWWTKLRSSLAWQERWTVRVAAAAAMLLVGIFIGSTFLPQQPQLPALTQTESGLSAMPAALAADTERYLERSKMLLMGMMNIDLNDKDEFIQNFSLQQNVSRDLAQQAAALTDKMEDPEYQQLVQLITDLRKILMQIANLEQINDFEEVELIQMGIRQNFVIFKINMRELSREPVESPPEYKDYL
jgi:hypothetical protein